MNKHLVNKDSNEGKTNKKDYLERSRRKGNNTKKGKLNEGGRSAQEKLAPS
jgi:hypothetical protein